MIRIPILTYHSANVGGESYECNDHVALARDLETIADLGKQVVDLQTIADWVIGKAAPDAIANGVGISFDDGCDFDFFARDFPGFGQQPGFRSILETHEGARATAFVLASQRAREEMDSKALFGRGDMTTGWWREADESQLIRIENHGWDHSHPDLDEVVQRDQIKGRFDAIDTFAECHQHVAVSAAEIARHSSRYPRLFAYPFGNSSTYMREHYLPRYTHEHHTLAAFSTAGRHVTADDSPWDIPRYVCGFHWRSPEALRELLSSS